MSADGFSVDIDPSLASVEARLNILEKSYVDLREFWPVWARSWYGQVQANFDAAGRLSGGWPRRKDGRVSHLTRSGRLRESFTWRGGARGVGPEGIYDPRSNSLTVGSYVPHAFSHQTGERHLPARPVLWWDDALANQFTNTWENWAASRVTAAGL